MSTRNLDIMLSRAGIYVVVTPYGVCLVEVDSEGLCFQLKLTDYSRDGELRPGGWALDQIRYIHGPFARCT